MTPAETIAKAAALMRGRAEQATPGPWIATHDPLGHHVETGDGAGRIIPGFGHADHYGGDNRAADMEHAASWHPVVALAVAAFLESWVGWAGDRFELGPDGEHALSVARAYLGGER